MRPWDSKLLRCIWDQVNGGCSFNFKVGPVAQSKLLKILPNLVLEVYERSPHDLNLALREIVSPNLRKSDETSLLLARWIVSNWGGIWRLKEEHLRRWMQEWNNFQCENVRAFIDTQGVVPNIGNSRISSWSKLLAFSDCEKYAIYDSRTAVALSCGLHAVGDSRMFFIPSSQNKITNEARSILNLKSGNKSWLGYHEYLSLLQGFKKEGLAANILSAEMVLFSNAPDIARKFLRDNRAQSCH
jgi:hypothetical protein